MTALVEVKVAELSGAALDYAVAEATKAWEWAHEWFPTMTLDPTFIRVVARECPRGPHGALVMTCLLEPRNPFRQGPQVFCPSTDWSQGGPLIEKYLGGCLLRVDELLLNAMRAIVLEQLGDVVSVPAELVGGVNG